MTDIATDIDYVAVKYKKRPRELPGEMKSELGHQGALALIINTVNEDPELRLDIRDRRFTVYYRGGGLLTVDGRTNPWGMYFAKEYFAQVPTWLSALPKEFRGIEDSSKWVHHFGLLKDGMKARLNGDTGAERRDCQEMAQKNTPRLPNTETDFLVIDIEYQWLRKRFDLMAIQRNPNPGDQPGWQNPHLVFVEVKSTAAACGGKAGLEKHASDYAAIVQALNGQSADGIKREYEGVIRQKEDLGLFARSLCFERLSDTKPKLMLVFVNVEPTAANVTTYVQRAIKAADSRGLIDSVSVMQLTSNDYLMTEAKAQPLSGLKT